MADLSIFDRDYVIPKPKICIICHFPEQVSQLQQMEKNQVINWI